MEIINIHEINTAHGIPLTIGIISNHDNIRLNGKEAVIVGKKWYSEYGHVLDNAETFGITPEQFNVLYNYPALWGLKI